LRRRGGCIHSTQSNHKDNTMLRTTLLTTGLLIVALTSAFADDYKVGSLVVTDPWSNATPKGATVGAGYMKITNTGTSPDRLISGTTDSASKFEVHEMKMAGVDVTFHPKIEEALYCPSARRDPLDWMPKSSASSDLLASMLRLHCFVSTWPQEGQANTCNSGNTL
jgi:hypothetical protein